MMTIFHAVLGIIYAFFWLMVFGLAKDRARHGAGYLDATFFAVSLVLFFTVLISVIGLVLVAGFDVVGEWIILITSNHWFLIGSVGFVCSAVLGAHFGVMKYHNSDKYK